TFRCVVCRIVLPGFRPWRDVGDLQGARCVMISAEVEPPHCGVIVVEPSQCDGSTAFAAARSCQGCRGFRRSLRSQRNGEACRREQGEMGGEGKDSGNGTPQPAAHLPFFSPLAAHHSAKHGSVVRNLPICDLRFAICEVRCMIGGSFTASERRHARSAINTIRSVVMGMPAPAIGISERCY
nr:hypothetical protein [Bacteroidales bacterium]